MRGSASTGERFQPSHQTTAERLISYRDYLYLQRILENIPAINIISYSRPLLAYAKFFDNGQCQGNSMIYLQSGLTCVVLSFF